MMSNGPGIAAFVGPQRLARHGAASTASALGSFQTWRKPSRWRPPQPSAHSNAIRCTTCAAEVAIRPCPVARDAESMPGSSTIATGRACHRRANSIQPLRSAGADVGRVDDGQRRFLSRLPAMSRTRSNASPVTLWSVSLSEIRRATMVGGDHLGRQKMLAPRKSICPIRWLRSARQARNPESRWICRACSPGKYRHLRRRPEGLIRPADAAKRYFISVNRPHAVRPSCKFGARPFKTMIGMAQRAGA